MRIMPYGMRGEAVEMVFIVTKTKMVSQEKNGFLKNSCAIRCEGTGHVNLEAPRHNGEVFVLVSAANVANFNLQLQCLIDNTGAVRWDADRLHTCIFAH